MGLISDIIYEGLRTSHEIESEKWRRCKHHKSLTASIVTACRRANWYRFHNIRPEGESLPVSLLSRFRDGNIAHESLRPLFRDAGVLVLKEEFGKVGLGIYVRVDYLIKAKGILYDVEFKTMAKSSFDKFLDYGVIAFPSYYSQCQVILHAEPIRPLVFLCKCKDSSAYEDQLVEPDEETAKLLKISNDAFVNDLNSQSPPEKPYGYSSVQCKGCEWKFRCWFSMLTKDKLEEKDLEKSEAEAVTYFYRKMQENRANYLNYLSAEQDLKNYIAFLHTKHGVSSIRLVGVRSVFVHQTREKENKVYVRSILTPEEQAIAFSPTYSKFFSTRITGMDDPDV